MNIVRVPEIAIERPGSCKVERRSGSLARLVTMNSGEWDGAGSDAFENVARNAGFNQRLAEDKALRIFEWLQIAFLEGIDSELPGVALREMERHFFRGKPGVGDFLGRRDRSEIELGPLPFLEVRV